MLKDYQTQYFWMSEGCLDGENSFDEDDFGDYIDI